MNVGMILIGISEKIKGEYSKKPKGLVMTNIIKYIKKLLDLKTFIK